MESLREVSSFRPPNETARGTHAAFLRSLTSAHASLRVTAASALASPSPLREAALLSWMRIVVILPSSSLVRFRLFSLSDMYTDLCTSLHPDALECMEKLNYQKKKRKKGKKKEKKIGNWKMCLPSVSSCRVTKLERFRRSLCVLSPHFKRRTSVPVAFASFSHFLERYGLSMAEDTRVGPGQV
jgi:hypothetical protein